jgi:ATPase subunit of ABC transporter with duplicated ATPase domains
MITVKDLTFSYGEKPLYEKVNFLIANKQKVGLVGPNGSGKSTLLKIILGLENPTKGKAEVRGKIGYVPQEVKRDPDMEKSETSGTYLDPNMDYSMNEIKKMLTGLQLEVELIQSPKGLSGGQKTKLALAKALLSEPDILLLDEPTNFMDVEGKKWVMEFLSNYKKSIVLISHDLELMDKAIDKVLSVNPQTRTIEEYKGNYSQYLRLKKEKEELLKREYSAQSAHIKNLEESLHKMVRLTSKKGVRARIRQQKKIEKAKSELPELPAAAKNIKIKLPEPQRVGEIPIRAIEISKSYGDLQVLDNIDFIIHRGERIALVGANGTGKSTLIKILMGVIDPDNGEVIGNENLKVGYYSQEFENFDLTKCVLDTFVETTHRDDSFARSFLGRYMFIGDKVFQRVESLSGGEKTRLSIAILTAQNYNLLVLDEPTTYLDVMSQRIILEALKEYKGSMILVSHTPEFVKELKPHRVFLFPEKKMTFWDDDLMDRVLEI